MPTLINCMNYVLVAFKIIIDITFISLFQESACSTFNFLNSEKRYVAAALIPPSYVHDFKVKDDLEIQDDEDIYNLTTNYTDPIGAEDDKFFEGFPEKFKEMMKDTSFGDHTHIDQERDEKIAKERENIVKDMKKAGLLDESKEKSKLRDEGHKQIQQKSENIDFSSRVPTEEEVAEKINTERQEILREMKRKGLIKDDKEPSKPGKGDS